MDKKQLNQSKRLKKCEQEPERNSSGLNQTGKASDYLYHLDDYYLKHPKMKAVLYCRVSACMQKYRDNPKNQKLEMTRKLKKRNIKVIACFEEVNSGWLLDKKRSVFLDAVNKAKKHPNAVIIAASSDRYLRNRIYESTEPTLLPTVEEYQKLMTLASGVPLLTLLHPDMDALKVRGHQSCWGLATKKSKGGRPRKKVSGYKKREKIEKLPIVIRLYQEGHGISEIAHITGLNRLRVLAWIHREFLN